MKKSTRKITVTAVFAALSTAFVYIAGIFPTGRIGILAAASLFGIAAAIECGISGCAAVYIGTSILSFLLVPNKSTVLIYVLFFGYYPLVKAVAEKNKSRVAEWTIKLAAVNAALAVMIFAVSQIVFDLSVIGNNILIAFIIVNAVFAVFDYCVTYFTGFYINKISRRIKKG